MRPVIYLLSDTAYLYTFFARAAIYRMRQGHREMGRWSKILPTARSALHVLAPGRRSIDAFISHAFTGAKFIPSSAVLVTASAAARRAARRATLQFYGEDDIFAMRDAATSAP